MKSIFPLILLFLFAGCVSHAVYREAPLHASPPYSSISPYPRLKEQLDALFPDSLFPPCSVGVKIRSLGTGETLYEANPDLLFNPGSNQKLITSAAAVILLGEDRLLTTRVSFDTTITPRIYLKGGGDPRLSDADLDLLAVVLAHNVPQGKQWTLAGDVSFFDDLPWGSGWMWDDEPDPTGMEISPLSVDGNAIRVHVRPGAAINDSVLVSTDPPTTYVTIENDGITAPRDSARTLLVTRKWRDRSNVITVTGRLPLNDSLRTVDLSVWQPAWYALNLLKERLEAKGISCLGTVMDTVPTTSIPAGELDHRLDSVLIYMNKTSDNLSAENLLKIMGATEGGLPGSAEQGIHAERSVLAGLGIDTAKLVIADGSGVSRYNLVTASILVQLLTAMHDDGRHSRAYENSLPVAGVDGTLARRMRGTGAAGNLRAKTGTLQGASALSGYVTTADGEQLVFAILMQNFPGRAESYRIVQDRIGAFLSALQRKQF